MILLLAYLFFRGGLCHKSCVLASLLPIVIFGDTDWSGKVGVGVSVETVLIEQKKQT